MLKSMSSDDLAKAIERAEVLTTFIQSVDWGAVRQVIVEWADDAEEIEPETFGQREVKKKKPTKEIMSIHIVCEPGTLPVPRKADGSPDGEGVFL